MERPVSGVTPHTLVNPPELGPTRGFSHGVLAGDGRTLYLAGQVGSDATGTIVAGGIVAQFDAALGRIVVRAGRGRWVCGARGVHDAPHHGDGASTAHSGRRSAPPTGHTSDSTSRR